MLVLQLAFILLLACTHMAMAMDIMDPMAFQVNQASGSKRCFTCNHFMLPGTTAKHINMFTCSHGKHIHQSCAKDFYDELPSDKRCPSNDCGHAPIVNPSMTTSLRKAFFKVYRSLGCPTPTLCAHCHWPFVMVSDFCATNLQSLRLASGVLRNITQTVPIRLLVHAEEACENIRYRCDGI